MLGRRDSDGKLSTLSSTQYLLCFQQIERLQKPSILMCNHAMGFRFESVWHVCETVETAPETVGRRVKP